MNSKRIKAVFSTLPFWKSYSTVIKKNYFKIKIPELVNHKLYLILVFANVYHEVFPELLKSSFLHTLQYKLERSIEEQFEKSSPWIIFIFQNLWNDTKMITFSTILNQIKDMLLVLRLRQYDKGLIPYIQWCA